MSMTNRVRVSEKNANVRWDSVVDCRRETLVEESSIPRAQAGAIAKPGERVVVKVWLYGTLADDKVKRPIELEFDGDATVASVIPELGCRLGDGFLHQVLDANGKKFNHCLVFVDGVKVDSLNVPVHQGAASLEVEMILLTITEGG